MTPSCPLPVWGSAFGILRNITELKVKCWPPVSVQVVFLRLHALSQGQHHRQKGLFHDSLMPAYNWFETVLALKKVFTLLFFIVSEAGLKEFHGVCWHPNNMALNSIPGSFKWAVKAALLQNKKAKNMEANSKAQDQQRQEVCQCQTCLTE